MPKSDTAVLRSYSLRNRTFSGRSKGTDLSRRGRAGRVAALGAATARAAQPLVETLESRELLSVSLDSSGFTNVTPGGGSRVIYVSSSSGNDSASGSQSSPVRSLAKAEKLLRSGAGDQMLLKRGDTWHESLGYFATSGASSSQPTVIGAYGSGARPVVDSGSANGINLGGKGTTHDIAILGIKFTSAGRGGASPDGIQSSGGVHNLLVEDCYIDGYNNNLTLQGFFSPITNVTLRRNVIVDSYSTSASHSEGLFCDQVQGITLTQNVFDHNGWGHGHTQTMFNHNVYITATCSGLTATGNVFADASSHGLEARPGGTVTGNLFYNNATDLSFGLVNGAGVVKPGGVSGVVSDNVFAAGHSINGLPAGMGILLGNINSATVTNNLFEYGDTSTQIPAINVTPIHGTANPGQAVGIRNLTISNNVVYHWGEGLGIGGGQSISHLSVTHNDFQNIFSYQAINQGASMSGISYSLNRYNVPHNASTPVLLGRKGLSLSQWAAYDHGSQNVQVKYPAPTRTLSSYNPGFISGARNLSRSNWNARYTASSAVPWIKSGFNQRSGGTVAPASATPTPTPTSTSTSSTKPGVTINDVATTEGNYGQKTFTFTVKLSARSSKTVTVNWETKGVTALYGKDYIGVHGTLTFAPGTTSKTISVKVVSDRVREGNDTFRVNLLSATNAVIKDSYGVGTIINDD